MGARWLLSLGMLVAAVACSQGQGGDEVEDTDEPGVGEGSSGTPPLPSDPPAGEATSTGAGVKDSSSEGGESTGGMPQPACLDGHVDPGEQCDDGNDENGDGCNRDCRFSGQLIWDASFGSGYGLVDEGFDVVPMPDGSAAVAGYLTANADGARDARIRRYTTGGEVAWEVTLAGPGGGNDEFRAISTDATGKLFAAGYVSGPKGQGLNGWVAAYDAGGSQLWTSAFNGPESRTDVFDAMVIDGDGNLVLGGYSQRESSGHDVLLRKVSSTGTVAWTRTFPGPNGGTDLVWDVGVSPLGHVFAAGYQQGPSGEGRNAWLGKFDTDGNEIWTRSFNGVDGLDDHLIGLTVVGDDDVVVSGYEHATGFPWRMVLRRYDSFGMIAWTDRYDGETGEGAHGFGLTLDLDEQQLVVTGGEIVDGVRHVLVRKYDLDGAQRWTTRVPGGAAGPDYGREVAVDAAGDIWVTGAVDTGEDARDVWVGRFTP